MNITTRSRAAEVGDIQRGELAVLGMEEYLTKADVAQLLKLTVRTVEHLMSRGALPYIRIGRSIRFRRRDLETHLASKIARG